MSWRPFDIFKSEDKISVFCDLQFKDHDIALKENTVRSLFVNSSIEEIFNKKIVDSNYDEIKHGKKMEK